MDYFVFFIPMTLVMSFFFYKIFHIFYNYEISKYFRPYSFPLILFDLLIQTNIEYFTFIGFRSLDTSFSFNFFSRMLVFLGIIMLFFTMIGSTVSYFIYYAHYKTMARYFLVNLFRFPSSYALMIIMYGLRPFLKGVVHAVLFDNWELQIWLLIVIELGIILMIFYFEFRYDNHRSKLIFMMDVSYSLSLVVLNVLLLLKYEYFKDDMVIRNLL